MRLLACLLLFCAQVFASDLKILQVVPFGTSSIKIVFNKAIQQDTFKEKRIENFKSFLEVEGVLVPFAKKKYDFPNQAQIIIAQNTPKLVRVVIVGNKNISYKTRVVEKTLYLSFVDEIPMLQEKGAKGSSNSHGSKDKLLQEKSSKDRVNKDKANKDKTREDKASGGKAAKEKPAKDSTSSAPASISSRIQARMGAEKRAYRIVIDPGHGGKDCGAMGITNICEKTIVLSVGKLLEQELKKRGYVVFMTRSSDVYVDLKKRTDMANAKNADLFVSIHANSVAKTSNKKSEGVETYFLSTARSERARDVAEQENKGDVNTMNYFSKLSFLNALNSHRLIASSKLAIDIQFGILRELKRGYDIVDGGVREGPFWVLAGALMPSVLIEIGYNSNENEAKRISDKDYQKSLAVGIANGIDGFILKNF